MTDDKPATADVSVIIPAYRARDTINRALASVAAQTLKPRDAIVVDDGSDDGTAEAAIDMKPRMNGVDLIVVRQENGGAGSARNRAVAHAKGDWLAFLDADDEWLPEKLERTVAAIRDSGRDPVLVGHDVIVREAGDETVFDCAVHDIGGADPFHALYRRGFVSTSTALAKRDAVVEAGGFDTGLPNAQDFDLWLALAAKPGSDVLVFPGAHTRHHNRPGSIQTYTERRLAYGLIIAARYVPELRARPGSTWRSLLFRGLAVHVEALASHCANRRHGTFIKTALLLPWRVGSLLLSAFRARPVGRGRWIPDPGEDACPGQP